MSYECLIHFNQITTTIINVITAATPVSRKVVPVVIKPSELRKEPMMINTKPVGKESTPAIMTEIDTINAVGGLQQLTEETNKIEYHL